MKDIELLMEAWKNTEEARKTLMRSAEIGQTDAVPVQLFTQAMIHLRQATSAIIELERRARGGQPADVGEKALLPV